MNHGAEDFQPPDSYPGLRDGKPWEDWEIILVLAACPEKQNYDSRRPWVRELAELIGRSPSAVSMHLGNLFGAKEGKGLVNVGRRTEAVYERFRGRDEELAKAAREIREELYRSLASPRIESQIYATLPPPTRAGGPQTNLEAETDQRARAEEDRLRSELLAKFAEARLPPDSIVIYRRHGSWWIGVMVYTQVALLYPREVQEMLRTALHILRGQVVVTTPAQLAIDGKQVALADREILARMPDFSLETLSDKDRVTLALRIGRLKSLIGWKPRARRLALFERSTAKLEADLVGKSFGIDASRLSNWDLIRLLELLDDAKKKHLV